MKKDLVVTFLTESVVIISGILVYRLAANVLGQKGFAEYALSRRMISFIQPTLMMGLGVGIPRYIAYNSVSSDSGESFAYFLGGLSSIMCVTTAFLVLFNSLSEQFAYLLFGNSAYVYLIFPMSCMLSGLVLHASCYGYYRGKLSMLRANSLQLLNMGIIPPLIFFIKRDLRNILLLIGLLWVSISFAFLICILKSNTDYRGGRLWPRAKELLIYGVQRVPGDFGMAALLALPAIFAAHRAGVKVAGFVSFGISLLNMAGAAFAPVGLILLPKASQVIAKKDFQLLWRYIIRILKITTLLTTGGVVCFEVFADKLIKFYLGAAYSETVFVTRIIFLAAIAYTIYISMRSIIDAYYVKSVNTLNILLSFLCFMALSGLVLVIKGSYVSLLICFVISIMMLGLLTLLEIRKLRSLGDPSLKFPGS